MDIQLSPEQQNWLKSEVEAGHFASLDDALSAAIVSLMAAKEDDLAWAKSMKPSNRSPAETPRCSANSERKSARPSRNSGEETRRCLSTGALGLP
ncbi:MAG: hypothetical protein ACLPIX_09560 [Rhodomicrobium sp.]